MGEYSSFFDKLVGKHKLQGIEQVYNYKSIDWYGDEIETNAIILKIDGINYAFVEDPDDGYRSFLDNEHSGVTDIEPKYLLPNIDVYIERKLPAEERNIYNYETSLYGIEIYDSITDKMVLRLGTYTNDKYYPECVLEYYPENFACNCVKE